MNKDSENRAEKAIIAAKEAGRKEGQKEGRRKGQKEGKEEGRKDGKMEAQQEILKLRQNVKGLQLEISNIKEKMRKSQISHGKLTSEAKRAAEVGPLKEQVCSAAAC